MADNTPGTAPITDHRVAPRGVLPRRVQTWILMGLALGILGIIVFTGHAEPAARPVAGVGSVPLAASPERLRDYQDRLRVLDARARQQAQEAAPALAPMPRYEEPGDGSGSAAPDPLDAERKRREYESLFASNVVSSRRPEGQRLMADRDNGFQSTRGTAGAGDSRMPPPPTLEDVAEAVVRAT